MRARRTSRAFFALVLAGVLCGGCAQAPEATRNTSDSQQASISQESGDATAQVPEGAISWEEASQHVGETTTVYGPVAVVAHDKIDDKDATFIDLGVAYPDPSRLSIVIYDSDLGAFSEDPQETYADKSLSVTGEIYVYDNECYIKATSPSQIEIVG